MPENEYSDLFVQYHAYWCQGSLRRQDISRHGIDNIFICWIGWRVFSYIYVQPHLATLVLDIMHYINVCLLTAFLEFVNMSNHFILTHLCHESDAPEDIWTRLYTFGVENFKFSKILP